MHCADDRNQRVKLIPQRQLGILPGIPSPIPMDARVRIFGEAQEMQLSPQFVFPMLIGLAGIIAWGGLWIVIAPLLTPSIPLPPLVKGALIGLVPFAPFPLFMMFFIHRGRQRIARIVSRHGFCASCGYALSNIPAAADGCTVCPECGSAWRTGTPPV